MSSALSNAEKQKNYRLRLKEKHIPTVTIILDDKTRWRVPEDLFRQVVGDFYVGSDEEEEKVLTPLYAALTTPK